MGVTNERSHHKPVFVEVHHGHIVTKGGSQSWAFQNVFWGEHIRCLCVFPQQDHRSTVISSGSPRYHGQTPLFGDVVASVQREA